MSTSYYSILDNINLQKLVQNKDALAYKELFNRYWDKVFVVCNNRLQNFDVAQDIVQDIFLSLWNHTALSEIENIEAYLYQACKYAVIKEFNKSSRYDSVDPTVYGILDRISDMSLDEVLEVKFLNELLSDQVERLPERTKIIFKYSREENLSSKEIADKLNISHRTVENQISFALKKLRNFIQNIKSFIFF